jgi:amino-acid N-acetyltransferase
MDKNSIQVRKACEKDVDAICRLLNMYADQGIVLRRSREDILSYLANFFVAVDAASDTVLGCGALRDFGEGLRELRSLAVAPDLKGRGIGRAIVEAIIERMRSLEKNGVLFTLTCEPAFFQRMGFSLTDRENFPPKIWSDCASCPRNDCCNETALEMKIASSGD